MKSPKLLTKLPPVNVYHVSAFASVTALSVVAIVVHIGLAEVVDFVLVTSVLVMKGQSKAQEEKERKEAIAKRAIAKHVHHHPGAPSPHLIISPVIDTEGNMTRDYHLVLPPEYNR